MDPCGASEWPWIINTHTYGKHTMTQARTRKKHEFHDRHTVRTHAGQKEDTQVL